MEAIQDSISIILPLSMGIIGGAILSYMLLKNKFTSETARLREEISLLRDKNNLLESDNKGRIETTVKAVTELEVIAAQRDQLNLTNDKLRTHMQSLEQNLFKAKQSEALAKQHADNVDNEAKRWEEVKQEVGKVAAEATLESSSKLLADHKRETLAAKQETAKTITETTEKLLNKFDNITKTTEVLYDNVKQIGKTAYTLQRSLSAPSSVGSTTETILENTLKHFNLREGIDFSLQHSVDGDGGGKLRPDAVVFMPEDTVLVIDAKASKHILTLAEIDDKDEVAMEKAYGDLKSTMNKHLKDLQTKDYASAVNKSYQSHSDKENPRQIITFMFLPNEAAVEKLTHSDPEFMAKAAKSNIIVGGQSSLWAVIAVAQMRINLQKQAENQQQVISQLEGLFQSIAIVIEAGGKLGRGLTSAVNAYDDFAKSVNGRLVSRSAKLIKLSGIKPPSKGLAEIPRLTVQKDAIDAETKDIEDDVIGDGATELLSNDSNIAD